MGTLVPNFFIVYFGQDVPHGSIIIIDKIDDEDNPGWIKKYLDPNRSDRSLPLAKANGPFGSMTIVRTDDYPSAALSLKKFFSPTLVAPAPAIFPA